MTARALAAGGVASVERARHAGSGVEVAVKRPLPGGSQTAAEFLCEAEMLERVRHPAVVAHVEHGIDPDGVPYLMTEWLEGQTLAERIARGPLPLLEALALGVRVADGLAALHAAGILHRDIKPENILLPGGEVARATLIDLGFASSDASPLLSGLITGTPAYMSPEQALGAPLDARSDLFSLGATLWASLAGRSPFADDDPRRAMARVVFADPDPLPDAPAELARLLADLLRKVTSERPATATAVRDALRSLLDRSTPRVPAAPQPVTSGIVSLRGRERELAWLDAVCRQAIGRGSPSALLITGDAGMGKSRLRAGWLASLRSSGQAPGSIWQATACPGAPGSSALAALVRHAILGAEDDPEPPTSREIAALVERSLPAPEAALTAGFLGHLLGRPDLLPPGPLAAVARSDASVMSGLIEQAFCSLAAAVAQAEGLLLVIDDAQWLDLPSLRAIERLLRGKKLPLVVAAFARPEALAATPPLFDRLPVEHLRLPPLDERDARQLALDLAPWLTDADIDAILEKAAGYPLFLIELSLWTRRHDAGATPPSLRALLLSRVAERSPLEQQALMACSMFTGSTPRDAFFHMLDGVSPTDLSGALSSLVGASLLAYTPRDDAFRFRHELMREATRASIPAAQASALHARALAWLAPRGEQDALLAEHAELAGLALDASRFHLGAARNALVAADFGAALRHADKALLLAPHSDGVAAIHATRANALAWAGRWPASGDAAEAAMTLARPGDRTWVSAISARCIASFEAGKLDDALHLVTLMCQTPPDPEAIDALLWSISVSAMPLTFNGCYRGPTGLVARRIAELADSHGTNPRAVGCRLRTEALLDRALRGDLGRAIDLSRRTIACFDELGDRGSALHMRGYLAFFLGLAADFSAAEDASRLAIATAEEAGARSILIYLHICLAASLLGQQRAAEALAAVEFSLGSPGIERRPFLCGWAHRQAAAVHLDLGDPEQAAHHAAEAAACIPLPCTERAAVLVQQARAAFELDGVDDALPFAREAVAIVDRPDPVSIDEPGARLLLARLLRAAGDGAWRHLHERALADQLARAALLDPPLRETFLAACRRGLGPGLS